MKHQCPHTKEYLAGLQALSTRAKVFESRQRIAEWVEHFGADGCYVSFSGGKDSTVLLDLVRRDYPHIPVVFVNTGLEYPEVVQFVRTIEGVTWLKPNMPFRDVIEKYGYPVVSKEVSQYLYEYRTTKSDKLRCKRWNGDTNKYQSGKIPEKWKFLADAPFKIGYQCCDIMKKRPFKKYEKATGRVGILGLMAADSQFRKQAYIQKGCNAFESNRPRSIPMAFWKEEDVWNYIRHYDLPYSDIYNKGYCNTGCAFCAFGCHLDQKNKFQTMKETHPKLHEYCMGELGLRDVLAYCNIPTEPDNYKQELMGWLQTLNKEPSHEQSIGKNSLPDRKEKNIPAGAELHRRA